MRIRVWNLGIKLFDFCFNHLIKIPRIDIKLKSADFDSANLYLESFAEGYF